MIITFIYHYSCNPSLTKKLIVSNYFFSCVCAFPSNTVTFVIHYKHKNVGSLHYKDNEKGDSEVVISELLDTN